MIWSHKAPLALYPLNKDFSVFSRGFGVEGLLPGRASAMTYVWGGVPQIERREYRPPNMYDPS